ncbi:MAG TPA: energy transducer TonB [Candidatus Angelobacter sp.]|nr:energy transducer TonB [Candidatus Angelobacter sp.]
MTVNRANVLILASAVLFLTLTFAPTQLHDSLLTRQDEARLDSLASLTAKKIREARLTENEPKVLVMDFFRDSPGNSSQLGTHLADLFSESLSSYATGMRILDRKIFKDYLHESWTTLEDFRSNEGCLGVARQLGAAGAILGTLTEKDDKTILLTLHLEGFGPVEKEDDIFAWRDRTLMFPLTEELRTALYQAGPNYTRSADKIPEEPGIFVAGIGGVTQPQCIYCPDPEYSDAARALKFQGNIVLSVIVTAEGQVKGIYVLKGAPFGLTDQAIKTTRNWRMQPAQKDGKPVSARAKIEIGFRLLD